MIDLTKIKLVAEDIMRYDDVGDYQGNTVITFNFSELHKRNGVLIHELVEYLVLDAYGIKPEVIDSLDLHRTAAKLNYPTEWRRYRRAHKLATKVEHAYIKALGIDWKVYDKEVNEQEVPVNERS